MPFPFESAQAYEASLRQPLGREWNALGAVEELTRPEWVTKPGLIIQPIRAASVTRGKGRDAAVAGIKSLSVGQGKRSRER